MMRKKVIMRSVQGDAMQAMQQGESPIVVIMPTESGKSVVFMLLNSMAERFGVPFFKLSNNRATTSKT
jgi:superfamily II DNA or RNA helicase